ncbi:Mov34/MPN/PAD-1 family protein [Bradyrhizobium sp. CCGUVB1N3]|uniref:Mov34/MPN/PAD-1 family protein n=1 Tax=Bradyrhizobium sp. CCGUVB1N3 TaxID=2949629 RepID=UPI0020B25F13|nr:Mov34/MPN/PAD-1 family protein [Bradyrhizobium sp. CCGUVB1N3]MCP3475824.1 Mov34/MPN/PAD-1 family protein [Bradyrhizobium sp. CCGUVB1N3]
MGPATGRESLGGVISFDIGHSGQSLRFVAEVLQRFDSNRQTRFWHREAGGLLFARFDLPSIDVCEATGPRPTDRRSRYSYRPDEKAEKAEIDASFSRGLHFVGCWHTHPEDIASPSTIDTRNISDCVRRSQHALNGFVMVIVGRAARPDSMFVSICDRSLVHQLARS